ncbi:MAG: hypothetical protein WCD37_17095 [Chloroflexia bacterium]
MNMIMHDGTRHFGDLPQTVSWYDLRDHIAQIAGAEITGFVTDDILEAWIDFDYKGYHFSVNDQYGEYWFFVDDPACPDDILNEVLFYCSLLLLLRPANSDKET